MSVTSWQRWWELRQRLKKSFIRASLRDVREERVYVRDAKVKRYAEDVCHWMLKCCNVAMPSMGAIVSLSLLEGGCECEGSQGQRHMKQAIFVLAIACPNHIIVNNLSAMRYARFGVWTYYTSMDRASATLFCFALVSQANCSNTDAID